VQVVEITKQGVDEMKREVESGGEPGEEGFPYYELDFGFGSPVCSMRNANAAWDSLFVFLPSSQSPENFTAMLHS
jgi:hypothetical protein